MSSFITMADEVPMFNSSDTDWIEYSYGLAVAVAGIILSAVVRGLSWLVMRIDVERTMVCNQNLHESKSHIIVGEYTPIALLGAPHVVRTRTILGFGTLRAVIIATSALSVASLSFSRSRELKTGELSTKATAVIGPALLSEDKIQNFADWFRSSNVVSVCSRRAGEGREYFQPYVEMSKETKVFCGETLPIQVKHESQESVEFTRPERLLVRPYNEAIPSTVESQYTVHQFVIDGVKLSGICNSGEYYRGIRSGRISQSCAFTLAPSLILGGYHTNQVSLSGPGQMPTEDDVMYFDSYTVDLGRQLTYAQLMQALTLWDLGSMSEVEVAALSTLTFKTEESVLSFTGDFDHLQVNKIFLIGGASVAGGIFLLFIVIFLWDRFSRSREERPRTNITSVRSLSRIMRIEATGFGRVDDPHGRLNQLAIRDVTRCSCRMNHEDICEVPRQYHLGSHKIGRPVQNNTDIRDILDAWSRESSQKGLLGQKSENKGGLKAEEAVRDCENLDTTVLPVMPGSQSVQATEDEQADAFRARSDSNAGAC